MKPTPEQWVKICLPFALAAEKKGGLHHRISLAQGAQESGWDIPVGNNIFGVKDTDGVNGNEILVTTTEYLPTANVKFPVNISVVKLGFKKYKYKVKDWFRKYSSLELAFEEHYNFFVKNKRYAKALQFKNNPERFFEEIAAAGYATDPNYATNLKNMLKSIDKRMPKK